MSKTELQPILLRHLRRAGLIDTLEEAPSVEGWPRFLSVVNDHYRNTEQDRQLLLRSNELASTEVDESRKRLQAQREAMRSALSTMADALGIFGRIAYGDAVSAGGLPSLEAATEDATRRLQALFGDTLLDDSSTELTGVRTNLVRLGEALGRLLDEMREKAELQKEVSAAAMAQTFLVPAEDRFLVASVDVVGACRPLTSCGGDWWLTETLADGSIVVVVGDATGHGIASSVVAGAARAACHVALAKGVTKPDELLRLMNDAVLSMARGQLMMTCGVTVVDPKTRKAVIASAAQSFAYHVQKAGVRPVVTVGQPLGEGRSPEYVTVDVTLEKGDLLIWYTDGLVEAENDWGEQLGEKRLRAAVQRLHGKSATAARDDLLTMLKTFAGDQPPNDDVTTVVVAAT